MPMLASMTKKIIGMAGKTGTVLDGCILKMQHTRMEEIGVGFKGSGMRKTKSGRSTMK